MYVYIRGAPGLTPWEVGFYDPGGKWVVESAYSFKREAMLRVNFLNGGTGLPIELGIPGGVK